jgi:hypothetical protein
MFQCKASFHGLLLDETNCVTDFSLDYIPENLHEYKPNEPLGKLENSKKGVQHGFSLDGESESPPRMMATIWWWWETWRQGIPLEDTNRGFRILLTSRLCSCARRPALLLPGPDDYWVDYLNIESLSRSLACEASEFSVTKRLMIFCSHVVCNNSTNNTNDPTL